MRIFTLLLAVCCSFMAQASSVPVTPAFNTGSTTVSSLPEETPVKMKKLSRFQKWELKILKKKLAKIGVNIDEDHLPTEHQRKLGRISLIFGIASIASLFTPLAILSLPFAIAGLILGLKSIKGNSNGEGIAGVVLSSLTLLFFILAIILIAAFLSGWN